MNYYSMRTIPGRLVKAASVLKRLDEKLSKNSMVFVPYDKAKNRGCPNLLLAFTEKCDYQGKGIKGPVEGPVQLSFDYRDISAYSSEIAQIKSGCEYSILI